MAGVSRPDAERAIAAAAAGLRGAIDGISALTDEVQRAGDLIAGSLASGGQVLLCGNGGSAADAQHMAAEMVGRFLKDRSPWPAIALSTNTSALTAIGNDYGFGDVFARQVRAHGRAGDVLVAISTSGTSPNVTAAIAEARGRGMRVVGLSGRDGGDMRQACDVCIVVPSDATPRIQEAHILVVHVLCGLVEDALA